MRAEHMEGCGGIVGPATTDDDMRRRGFTEAAIREVRSFEAYLRARGALEFHGTFQEWRFVQLPAHPAEKP